MGLWALSGLGDYVSVRWWLGRLHSVDRDAPLSNLRWWFEWMREPEELGSDSLKGGQFALLTPDELIAWQKDHLGGYEILDLVQSCALQKRTREGSDAREGTKRRIYTSVRSFFLHNRAPLPQDPSFQISSETPRVVGTLSIDEFRRVLDASNPMYRAIFLSMFQGGIGKAELLYWSRNGLESLRSQIQRGAHPIRVDLPGRKRNRNKKPYYTYLGADAADALGVWLKRRPAVRFKDIFVTAWKTPLNMKTLNSYWRTKVERLGIVVPTHTGKATRYGKNIHEIRDLFKTRCQKSNCNNLVSEFLLGHNIDPLEYNKAMSDTDYTAREHRKAEAWLNILSEDPEKVPLDTVEETQYRLEKRIRELEQTSERARRLDQLLEDPEVYEAFLKTLRDLKDKRSEN